ncbi:MAG: hypothetical protein RLZZ227_2761 [Pseudomonadota bacterium]|jgi:hypothetical protein
MQMLKHLFVSLLFLAAGALAQEGPAPSVATEYAFTIEAKISAALTMGPSVDGERRAIPITGGIVTGADIKGEVIPGGADYQVTRADGTTFIRAVYMVRTDDGALINVVNEGYIVPPGSRGNDALYFRTRPEFTAPSGKYGWLNSTVFVCTVRFDAAKPQTVLIDVYKVL